MAGHWPGTGCCPAAIRGGKVAIRSTVLQGRRRGGREWVPREHSIMRGIMVWLQAEGIFHFRLNNFPMPIIRRQGHQRVLLAFKPVDTPGLPDIAGVLPDGRAFFIEVKRPGARPQNERERTHWERQRAFLDNARSNKAVAIMVDSVDAAVDSITAAMDGDA